MKKIMLCFLMLTIVMTTFSQQTKPSPALTKQDYRLKANHQQVAALILLSGGVVIGGIGAITTTREVVPFLVLPFPPNVPDEKKVNTGGTLMTIGTVVALGSIPFFIVSSRNKKKAMSMSFINQPVPQLQNNGFVYQAIPSLKLKISL